MPAPGHWGKKKSRSQSRSSLRLTENRRRYIVIFAFMNTTMTPPVVGRLGTLGDETRTRILALLDRSEFTVSELCSVLRLAQPTVSRHLKKLASDGWVESRAEGRSRHYRMGSTDEWMRGVWDIVREEVGTNAVYRADAERSRVVLRDRRMRSAAFFAATAADWDDRRVELFGSATGLAPLLGLLNSAWTVGDLGTGTGQLSARIAPFVSRVIAIDRSVEMRAAAKARLSGFTNVEVRDGELEALPIEDGRLDLAILALVLHYVVDPAAVLAEAHRALTAGGTLLLLEMRSHDKGAEYATEMGHVWPGFEQSGVEGWLRGCGFGEVRSIPLPPDPKATGPLLFLTTARA